MKQIFKNLRDSIIEWAGVTIGPILIGIIFMSWGLINFIVGFFVFIPYVSKKRDKFNEWFIKEFIDDKPNYEEDDWYEF